ncbi:Cation/H+ exchanger [Haematococcus lacustris]
MVLQHVIFAFSVAAILAPFSYYSGLAARYLKLPQLTGYLLSGIVCGPYLLGILSSESVRDLNIIEGACLSIIGLAAGAELDVPSLHRSRKQVLGITAGICLLSWVLCFGALDWLGLAVPSLHQMDSPHLLAVATLGATLMMTRSPASAIAVLKDIDGRGPFCSLVMAVVVVKDVVVICAFALNMELIRTVILPAKPDARFSLLALLLPLLSVALSMALGLAGALLLSLLLRWRPLAHTGPGPGLLPSSTAQEHQPTRLRQAAVLLVSSAVFQAAHFFEAEALLACVTMGMVLVNRRHERADKEREELHSCVTHIMALSNVAFFGLIGASLKLSSLADMLLPALVVAAVRLAAIYLGSWLGCFCTGTLAEHRRLFWASMVTQAGVAMGLARLAGTRFPQWGAHFQTFMMTIILVNLLLGPPLFRWAVLRVGEVRGGAGAVPSSSTGPGGLLAGAITALELAGDKVLVQAAGPCVGGEQRAGDCDGPLHDQ